MIIEMAGRRAVAVAVAEDVASARYDCARLLTGTTAAGPARVPTGTDTVPVETVSVRLLVEIRRNLGGMIMRAMVGGEFRSGGENTRYKVCVAGEPFDSGTPPTCDSELGDPLIPGLPADFAQATLNGLMADATQTPIPAGVVRIDRAGHDLMGSSDAAFGLAARVLRGALAARLTGGDLETGARAAYRDPS
jgi:hypothetical protein